MSYQALTVLTPLITTPYTSRVLKPEGIGIYSFAYSVVSYFVLLANLGTVTYAQREISYYQDDISNRSTIFWNTFCLRLLTSLCTLLIYLIFSFCSEFRYLLLILSVNIVAVIFDISWLYQGMEDYGTIMKKNILFRILTVVFIFLFVRQEKDLPIYCLIMAAGTFLGNGSMWTQITSMIDRPDWKHIRPFFDIKTVLSLFVPTIAIQIYTILDKTMIGLFSGVGAENGYYEQAMKFARLTQMVVTSLSTVMISRIGYCFIQEENQKLKNYIYRSYQYVWALAIPMSLGLIGISDNFIPWFLGEEFSKVGSLLKLLSLLVISIGVNTVTGNEYLIPTKRQNLYTKTVVTGALMNVCLNALLIPAFLSIGAAIASVCAETWIAMYQLYLMRHELSVSEVMRRSVTYLLAGAGMFIVLSLENRYLNPSPLHTLCMVATGASTYLLLLILLKDRFLIDNLKRIAKAVTKS